MKIFNIKRRIIISLLLVFSTMIFFACETQTDDIQINEIEKENKTEIIENKKKENARFIFVGDIMPAERLLNNYDKGGISNILDDKYKNLFDESNLNVGNLEIAVTDLEETAVEKTYHFKMPVSYTKCLKEIGINLFTLANNHIMDYGEEGILSTIQALKDEKLSYIGAGNDITEASAPYIAEINGATYAIFGCSMVFPDGTWKARYNKAGTNTGNDVTRICDNIKKYKEKVDKVFIYMHWGNELEEISNERQQNTAHYLVNAGADLVIGSHSHTIQEIEYYREVPIIYSLGNFLYGGTKKEMIVLDVNVDYSENAKGDISIKLIPGIADYLKTIKMWNKNDILQKYNEIQSKSNTAIILSDGVVLDRKKIEKIATKSTISEEKNN